MIIYDDIRHLTAARIRADLGFLPSCIVGSPPCQDASLANAKGKGVDGDRTGLFFEAIRLVDECRPVWGCFENVPGLRTRGADRVLDALEAIGYACWPLVVGACHVGAPHKRNRVWIVFVNSDFINENSVGTVCSRAISKSDRVGQGFAANMSRVGCGSGTSGRFGTSDPREHEQTFQEHVFANSMRAEGENGRNGVGGRWEWCSEKMERNNGGNPDGPRLALGEGERRDDEQELPPALGAIGRAWRSWGEPLARHLRMADGVPSLLARASISAYGDSVVPQITEAIGQSMMDLLPTDGTVLDLFAGGAGGWSLGMHRAGFRTVAMCEIDPWRREALRANFGD